MNQAFVRSGMMLAAVPPSWMIPWTRLPGPELLAPQADRREQHDHRVEGVLALPRVGGGVRLEAVEDDVDVLRRERLRLDVAAIARVEQQRGVDALRTGRPRSSTACRSPAPPPASRGTRSRPGSSSAIEASAIAAPDAGRGHRVVAAAVAEPGQRVVLGEDPDPRAPRRRARPRRVARIAVSSRPAGCSTSNPCARRISAIQPAAWRSSKAGSGLAWIRCDSVDDLVARGLDGGGEPRLGVARSGSAGRTRVSSPVKDDLRASALDRQRRLGDERRARGRTGRSAGWKTRLRRRTTKTAVTRKTQPPRRIARGQSPRYAIRRWRPKTTSQNSGRGQEPERQPEQERAEVAGPGSTVGSRVVKTRATRMKTMPPAARKPRLARRSRASITHESRGLRRSARNSPTSSPTARSRGPHRRSGRDRSTAAASRAAAIARRPPASPLVPPRRRPPPSRRRRGGSRPAPDRRAGGAPRAKIAGCGLIVPTRWLTTIARRCGAQPAASA